MSYPQPGPYGQQPPPNPYGQGGAPGQPGYGYPQQPPAPYGAPPPPPPPPGAPYGAPPQPQGWGQPQAPQPQGWGQQPGMPGGYPPPTQPSGGGAGKAIGITVGVLVVVGAIVGGVLFMNGGGGSGGGDVKPYTIDLPVSLLNGKFVEAPTPAGAQNQPQSLADNEQAKAAGIEGGTSVSKKYTNAEKQGLSISGTYGTINDPKKTVDSLLAMLDERQKKLMGSAKVNSGPWTDYSPSGFDGAVMKCRTQKVTVTMGQFSTDIDGAQCIWGDTSAVGSVSHQVSKSNSPYGAAAGAATGNVMSTQELSDATAKIRNEVRKEK
ncbi:hypothetical protein ABZ545_18825 [Streptomyces abikoensis]|uniref:hypothetical protein n=1 Tax=Streptomyces abikoensis TaxID=97398 RepID=UPI0033D7F99C